jgi:hypothetical protein
MVVTPYGLMSKTTTDAAHYFAGDPKQPTSQVIVRHPSVMVERAQMARAEVFVDLRRTDAMTLRENAEREPEVKLLPSGYRRW